MVLLATRISACQLNHQSSDYQLDQNDDDEIEENLSEATTETLPGNNQDLMSSFDKIIIWVASNIATNLSYTIAASTLSMNVRQKYFGPMVTLGEDAIELCKTGECLTLSHFHINGMSENGRKPLALDVVIHSND